MFSPENQINKTYGDAGSCCRCGRKNATGPSDGGSEWRKKLAIVHVLPHLKNIEEKKIYKCICISRQPFFLTWSHLQVFFLSCWTTFHMIRHKISFHIWIYEFEFKIYAFHTKHILRLKPAKFVDNKTKLLGRLQTFIIDSKDNTIHFVSIKISTICNFFSEHLYKLFTPHFRSKGFVKNQRLLSNCLIA